jgi:GTP cyclohydrolase I
MDASNGAKVHVSNGTGAAEGPLKKRAKLDAAEENSNSATVKESKSSTSDSSQEKQEQICSKLKARQPGDEEDEERLNKMAAAVNTLLECLGEDPQREGLVKTPMRMAKALLFCTNGYSQTVSNLVNGAIFEEDHSEMVVVRDINIHSLCEHHMVPFTGKVRHLS